MAFQVCIEVSFSDLSLHQLVVERRAVGPAGVEMKPRPKRAVMPAPIGTVPMSSLPRMFDVFVAVLLS